MGIWIFVAIVAIFLVILIEWLIGIAIGKAVSKSTGLILGIILILCGVTLFIAIPIIIYSNKNKEELFVNLNLNERMIYRDITPAREYYSPIVDRQEKLLEAKYEKNEINIDPDKKKRFIKFIGKNWKDVLLENRLEEYIDIFTKNKLTDLEIISELTEYDLEKLGITIMGDRKKILKIFSTSKNSNEGNEIMEEISITENNSKSDIEHKIGNIIRLKRLGWSVEEIARCLDISIDEINNIMNGGNEVI
jgi:hypothetical protein